MGQSFTQTALQKIVVVVVSSFSSPNQTISIQNSMLRNEGDRLMLPFYYRWLISSQNLCDTEYSSSSLCLSKEQLYNISDTGYFGVFNDFSFIWEWENVARCNIIGFRGCNPCKWLYSEETGMNQVQVQCPKSRPTSSSSSVAKMMANENEHGSWLQLWSCPFSSYNYSTAELGNEARRRNIMWWTPIILVNHELHLVHWSSSSLTFECIYYGLSSWSSSSLEYFDFVRKEKREK